MFAYKQLLSEWQSTSSFKMYFGISEQPENVSGAKKN